MSLKVGKTRSSTRAGGGSTVPGADRPCRGDERIDPVSGLTGPWSDWGCSCGDDGAVSFACEDSCERVDAAEEPTPRLASGPRSEFGVRENKLDERFQAELDALCLIC